MTAPAKPPAPSLRVRSACLHVRETTHSDFDPTLVACALVLALGAGFVPAIVMAGAIAGLWPIGAWWGGIRQVHGHVQLFGWIALFVLGTGSFFLPRARGAALAFPAWLPWIAAALGGGVLLRAASQLTLGLAPGPVAQVARIALGLSAALELAGVFAAVALFATTFRAGAAIRSRPHLHAVLPLLAAAFSSLLLATLLSSAGAVLAAARGSALVEPLLDRCTVELMIFGFALPATQAVSAQTFPLFLRLPVPSRSAVAAFACGYLASAAAMLLGIAARLRRVEGAGAIGVAISLLAFTLLLDVLTRRRTPWVAAKIVAPAVASRRATRPGLPDRGEYGRFEWLVYSAYAWQTLGAILLGLGGAADLTGHDPWISPDAARHALTLGFLTLLILGMAVRMFPGFLRTRLVLPEAVTALAIAANVSTACRVLPLLVPMGSIGSAAIGASGFVAWATIALLAAVLGATWRRAARRSGDSPPVADATR